MYRFSLRSGSTTNRLLMRPPPRFHATARSQVSDASTPVGKEDTRIRKTPHCAASVVSASSRLMPPALSVALRIGAGPSFGRPFPERGASSALPLMLFDFESHRWRLCEIEQVNRLEEKTVVGLRKPRGGRCRVVESPRKPNSSGDVARGASNLKGGRIPRCDSSLR
jgi:hypothetical protein